MITLLSFWVFALLPVMEATTQEELPQETDTVRIVVLHPLVGKIIDLEERNHYELFRFSENFKSAVLLQGEKGDVILLINEEREGVESFWAMEYDQQAIDRLSQLIDNTPVMKARDQETFFEEEDAWELLEVTEKVGKIIDLEERNHYRLFRFTETFQSALLLQRSDSCIVALITEEEEGVKNLRTMEMSGETLGKLREHIDTFDGLTPAARKTFFTHEEEFWREETVDPEIVRARIIEAKEQINVLVKEKWTGERWREERSYDRGISYSTAGGYLGFTVGAAAGMLIGKGFQGKEVERQEFHEGGWDEPSWTENFYSYENRHAPHWGAAIGGVAGATAGYFLGKQADKRYYILVPKEIRTTKTKSSWFGNFLFGFGVVGPLMGAATGWALYSPLSGEDGKSMGTAEFLGGYIVGAFTGTTLISSSKGRSKRKQLCEELIGEEDAEFSLNIEFVPLDPTALRFHPRTLPNGRTFLEYRMDILRLRF